MWSHQTWQDKCWESENIAILPKMGPTLWQKWAVRWLNMLETYQIYLEEKIKRNSEVFTQTVCCKHPSQADIILKLWPAVFSTLCTHTVHTVFLCHYYKHLRRTHFQLDLQIKWEIVYFYNLSACVFEHRFSSEISSMIMLSSNWSYLTPKQNLVIHSSCCPGSGSHWFPFFKINMQTLETYMSCAIHYSEHQICI